MDLSATGMPRLVQENMVAYMRLFAGLSGVESRDADTYWLISNKPAPGNFVLRTRLTSEDVEERIDTLLAEIGQVTDHIDWFYFPGDQPEDLSIRLGARGLPGGPGGNWLWKDLLPAVDLRPMPTGFRIERITSDSKLSVWTRVSEEGFGQDLTLFYDAYARHGYHSDASSLHYLGYYGNLPVTSGTILTAGGCASIYDLSTPPKFRRQGFAGAIMRVMLAEIRSRGYRNTWIWSSDIARGLYQKLGYVDADFGQREHAWQRS